MDKILSKKSGKNNRSSAIVAVIINGNTVKKGEIIMKNRLFQLMASTMAVACLAGCVSTPAPDSSSTGSASTGGGSGSEGSSGSGEAGAFSLDGVDLQSLEIVAPGSDAVDLKVSIAFGNTSRTISYGQSNPLTLSDGTVVTNGDLKPVWQYVQGRLNVKITDALGAQGEAATDMLNIASTSAFQDAHVYGGNSVADLLVNYGTQGLLLPLNEKMDEGLMPNFVAYLEENPTIETSITAQDGNIYYVPYIAEIGSPAREWIVRGSWPEILLDGTDTAFDTHVSITSYYEGAYTGSNARTGSNGGTVTPKDGVSITKATNENIIEIQNALSVKNGETLTNALIEYIGRNYEYENPSQLFIGELAAADVDELVALWRCIKANPELLTERDGATVYPFFARQGTYREDLLRMANYFNGTRAHGADSYEARFILDESGNLVYTYAQEGMYEVLVWLSQIHAEGLINPDIYSNEASPNIRTQMFGNDDDATKTVYGYMTFDWISSTTASSLNTDTTVVLPPVANVNGVWQYFVDNTRVVKPDGWSISAYSGHDDASIEAACALLDYYFTEEGALVHNYGLPFNLASLDGYEGPDGNDYPIFDDWIQETSNNTNNGDISSFLRDWMGSHLAIGYQKDIGFEYQTTGDQGMASWELINGSTTGYPSYSGAGPEGDNPNYYYLSPTVIPLNERQIDTVATQTKIDDEDTAEFLFNIIRYQALGNASGGASMAYNYDEYLKFFTDAGLDLYVSTYQTAYDLMQQG
ncbi:MAG: hypothetical protein R3Y63_09780 [Eubacteriales bacterium]